MVRRCLSLFINASDHMKVVAEISDSRELFPTLAANSADVLLLDLGMPGMNGFHTAGRISELYPRLKILVLTVTADQSTIRNVIRLGLHGYFTKNTDPKELRNAILKLQDNGFYFEKHLADIIEPLLKEQPAGSAAKEQVAISRREKEIILLTAKELCGKEIAAHLDIAYKTVQRHKENLIRKTGAKNFMGVLIYALSRHILSVEDLNTG